MSVISAGIFALLCGAAMRLRGSDLWNKWTGTGTTGGRALWSVVVGACIWATYPSYLTLLTIPLLFAGAVPGWPGSIDLGRNEGTWGKDFALMTVRGLLFTFPAGAYMAWLVDPSYLVFAFSGALAGVLYEAAWRIPVKYEHLRQGPPLGEFLFGVAVGLSLVAR